MKPSSRTLLVPPLLVVLFPGCIGDPVGWDTRDVTIRVTDPATGDPIPDAQCRVAQGGLGTRDAEDDGHYLNKYEDARGTTGADGTVVLTLRRHALCEGDCSNLPNLILGEPLLLGINDGSASTTLWIDAVPDESVTAGSFNVTIISVL